MNHSDPTQSQAEDEGLEVTGVTGKGTEANGRGRPKIQIDLDTLEKLSRIGATNREVAAFFNVSERTIDTRRRSRSFRDAMERGQAKGDLSLRRKQWDKAMAGDNVMMIWLGKQRLKQQDQIKQEYAGGLEVKVTVRSVLDKKEN